MYDFFKNSILTRGVCIICLGVITVSHASQLIKLPITHDFTNQSIKDKNLNMLLSPMQIFKSELSKYEHKLLETLNPPATDAEIEQAEKDMGLKLPDKVRALYKVHNGQDEGGLFAGLTFLSLKEAVTEWQDWEALADENYTSLDNNIISVSPHYIQEVYASKFYFPIATDRSGNNLVIDLAPASKGTIGQVINAGAEEDARYVIANDIDDFLILLTSQVKSNNIILDEQSWYLKDSKSYHFFESLDVLPLPVHDGNIYEDEPIEFATWKNNLSLAWQNKLNRRDDSVTSWEELRAIRRFMLTDKNIDEVSPLTKMLGLREVILSASDVADISPLKVLPNLKTLYLSGTRVTSVSDILRLSSLKVLSINSTPINSLKGLNTLDKLKSLNIEDTLIKDLEEVGKITTLNELSVSKNTFDSFKPLNNLTNLTELDISETNFADLNDIDNLRNLQGLYMNDTLVTNYNGLNSFKKLKNIQCTFDEFLEIKKVLNKKVSFTMVTSGLTEAQRKVWDEYRDS